MTKEHTGLFYSDGSLALDGDNYTMYQESEFSEKLTEFNRAISWSSEKAAYVNDRGRFLVDDFQDVNTVKVLKQKEKSSRISLGFLDKK